MSTATHKIILALASGIIAVSAGATVITSQDSNTSTTDNDSIFTKQPSICDGKTITEFCEDDQGIKYEKYLWHDAIPATQKEIQHPAEPAKTHIVYHEAVYGTRQVKECIKTDISNKNGTCALSRCRDGSYSGSTGRGTCSHHGGVARNDGPWYVYHNESYVVTPAWTETVIDQPAKDAWTETIIVTPAIEAYLEKIPMP